MKIGVTERGDPIFDLSWVNAYKNNVVDGMILITKHIDDNMINILISLYEEKPHIIVHATCTGWGGTFMQSKVPSATVQLNSISKLIENGFSKENIVLRIDPIIPNREGLARAVGVLNGADNRKLLPMRVRISLLDQYNHVKERFKIHNFPLLYGGKFGPTAKDIQNTVLVLSDWTKKIENQKFETCAEECLINYDIFNPQGCVSNEDLKRMKINNNEYFIINPQNRKGCLCLNCKTELLTNKKQCPHGCLYCYWH